MHIELTPRNPLRCRPTGTEVPEGAALNGIVVNRAVRREKSSRCTMRIVPVVSWELVGDLNEPVDPRLVPLLDSIAHTGSIAAAVARVGGSYRAAWGLLYTYERKLGVPLVQMTRGRGSSLTPLGKSFLDGQLEAATRLNAQPALAVEVLRRRGNPESPGDRTGSG